LGLSNEGGDSRGKLSSLKKTREKISKKVLILSASGCVGSCPPRSDLWEKTKLSSFIENKKSTKGGGRAGRTRDVEGRKKG